MYKMKIFNRNRRIAHTKYVGIRIGIFASQCSQRKEKQSWIRHGTRLVKGWWSRVTERLRHTAGDGTRSLKGWRVSGAHRLRVPPGGVGHGSGEAQSVSDVYFSKCHVVVA